MPGREKLIEFIVEAMPPCYSDVFACRIADRLISEGVTVRERGRWEKISHYPYYCSCCGEIAPLDCEGESHYKSNFCPNCGADMRTKGEGEEDG